MTRINIICEGQTEEAFVNKVLGPYFQNIGIILTVRNLKKGDSYGKLRDNIVQWMKEDQGAYLTTLVDLYGMDNNFPGYQVNKDKEAYDKILAVEAAVKVDIDEEGFDTRRFIPYFQLHEFEALLFSDPEILEQWLGLDRDIPQNSFQTICNDFETPEHINDNPRTAPSKRILSIVPGYSKVAEGVLIAEDIGLAKMRTACRHFDEWLKKLEALAPEKPNPQP